jgi:fatty acid/phospholipid biosynthesis enzyme
MADRLCKHLKKCYVHLDHAFRALACAEAVARRFTNAVQVRRHKGPSLCLLVVAVKEKSEDAPYTAGINSLTHRRT